MQIIDLTLPLFHGMPVYPGDPEVSVEQVHFLEKDGWNLSTICLNTHLATHVNVPFHMVSTGKKLDEYPLEAFVGQCRTYQNDDDIQTGTGVLFVDHNIDQRLTELISLRQPKFIGLSEQFDFDIALEKKLLEQGIISFENLTNTHLLPREFQFFGVPLKLEGGDGSVVRAFAIIV